MAIAADAVLAAIVEQVPALDTDAVRAQAARYIRALESLDAEVADTLAAVPQERRVLVTNHEVFGYFADRYGFDVIGAVVPGGTTGESVSAAQLAALADTVREHDVPAIFADTSSAGSLTRTLAAEVGDVDVVELFSESLGAPGSGGETYIEMVRTNAQRIVAALA
jgi:zinc/manganese transport system substrate-binding protein